MTNLFSTIVPRRPREAVAATHRIVERGEAAEVVVRVRDGGRLAS